MPGTVLQAPRTPRRLFAVWHVRRGSGQSYRVRAGARDVREDAYTSFISPPSLLRLTPRQAVYVSATSATTPTPTPRRRVACHAIPTFALRAARPRLVLFYATLMR